MPQTASTDADFIILVADERLETMRLDRFYRDWRKAAEARGEGGLPDAGFLDSQPFEYLAGAKLIFDVERNDESCRYRYRHMDPQILVYSRRDMTGLCIDEHEEPYFAETAGRAMDLVTETRRPIHARVHRLVDGVPYVMEFLVLPLTAAGAAGDGMVDVLFVAQLFARAPA
jgi:hypothetical protein